MKNLIVALLVVSQGWTGIALALSPPNSQTDEVQRFYNRKRAEAEAKRRAEEQRIADEKAHAAEVKQQAEEAARKAAAALPPLSDKDADLATESKDAKYALCWDRKHQWFTVTDLSKSELATHAIKTPTGDVEVKYLKVAEAKVFYKGSFNPDAVWSNYTVEKPAMIFNGTISGYELSQPGAGASMQFRLETENHVQGSGELLPPGEKEKLAMDCKFLKTPPSAKQISNDELKKLEK